MLQFLVGLTSINLSALRVPLFGTVFFNAPAMAFVCLAILTLRRTYDLLIDKRLFYYLSAFLLLGMLAHVLDPSGGRYVIRQLFAFGAMALVCHVLYEESRRRSFLSYRNAAVILGLYLLVYALFYGESMLGSGGAVYRAIFNLIASQPEQQWAHASAGRFTFFQPESPIAAIAIASILMPFLVGRCKMRPLPTGYVFMGLGIFCLILTGTLTGDLFVLYTVAYLVLPSRLMLLGAFVGVVVYIVTMIAIVKFFFSPSDAALLVQSYGIGLYEGLDARLASGSAIGRLMMKFFGILALLDSPWVGNGIGGFPNFFYEVSNRHDVTGNPTVEALALGTLLNVPNPKDMYVRIGAENGIPGLALLLYLGLRLVRFVEGDGRGPESLHEHALRYAVGALCISFLVDDTLLNPALFVLVALIGHVQRERVARDQERRTPGPPLSAA